MFSSVRGGRCRLDCAKRSRHEWLRDIAASCTQSHSDVSTGVIEVWGIKSTICKDRNERNNETHAYVTK